MGRIIAGLAVLLVLSYRKFSPEDGFDVSNP
jgi:hypothetical protein